MMVAIDQGWPIGLGSGLIIREVSSRQVRFLYLGLTEYSSGIWVETPPFKAALQAQTSVSKGGKPAFASSLR